MCFFSIDDLTLLDHSGRGIDFISWKSVVRLYWVKMVSIFFAQPIFISFSVLSVFSVQCIAGRFSNLCRYRS